MINTPNKQIHPALQFVIFIALTIAVFLVGNIAGIGIAMAMYGMHAVMAGGTMSLTSPHAAGILWRRQRAVTTRPILIAPFFFAVVIVRDPEG